MAQAQFTLEKCKTENAIYIVDGKRSVAFCKRGGEADNCQYRSIWFGGAPMCRMELPKTEGIRKEGSKN